MAQRKVPRSRLPRGGIGRRLALLTFVSSSAVALALTAIALVAAHALARQRIEALHPVVQEWSGERVVSWLGQAKAELEAAAHSEALAGALSPDEAPDAGPASAPAGPLEAIAARAHSLTGLLALDPGGAPLAWAGSSAALPALRGAIAETNALESDLATVMRRAELLRALTTMPEATVQALDLGAGEFALVVSTPLRAAGGDPLGSLHGLLDRDALAAQLRVDLLGAGGAVSLVRREGGVIGAAGALTPERMDSLASAIFDEDGSARPRLRRVGGVGWAVVSARPVEELHWSVVVVQDALVAYSPLLATLVGAAACAPLLALLFASLSSAPMARLVRPIGALDLALRDVATGDLDTELRADGVRGELGAAFRAFNAMTAQLRTARERQRANLHALSEQNQVFQQKHAGLSRLSITDGLTELNNHRYFQDQLRHEIKRLSRTGQGLALLIIDIDDFKQLNDSFGHAAGDEFLKQLARIMKEAVRETDLLARYGGEEFVIVATNTDVDGAVTLAEKVRTRVSEASFIVDETLRPRRMTVSIGVAPYERDQQQMFAAADGALYRAKSSGKNCVVYGEPGESAS